MSGNLHIITYHSIDDSGSVLSIAPGVFRAQLEAWRARGARFLRMEDVRAAWCGGVALPSDGLNVLVTFDDGLTSVYERAFPVLSTLEVPACVFVCTGLMGGDNAWPGQPAWVPRMPIMSWAQAREMHEAGIEFASHLRDHPDISTLSEADARVQLSGSKRDLEEHLGVATRVLAFPYGRSTPAAMTWAEEEYDLAFGTRMGAAGLQDARMDLPRWDAYYLRPPWVYRNLGRAGAGAYLAMRRGLRRLRGH